MSKLLIIFFVSFLSIDCLLKDQINLQLSQGYIQTETVGKKGTVIVTFEQKDVPKEFKNTKKEKWFDTTISNGDKSYNISCGLWNSRDEYRQILAFCYIEENIPSGNYSISFKDIKPFTHGNYYITLIAKEDSPKFQKVDKDIIDLYSDTQEIIIENSKDSYELNFNIVSYNQEKLIFNYNLVLDCKIEGNILKCPLTKKDLFAYIPGSVSRNNLHYFDTTKNDRKQLLLIGKIKVENKDIPKKDIFISIKKLLVDANEKDVPIAYETNVTNISNIHYFNGDGFKLKFINNNSEGIETEFEAKCHFLKYENNPLILVCWVNKPGTNRLKAITEEIIIDNYNLQYNYRIQKVENEEIIKCDGDGSFISWYYPKILDFSKNTGSISIQYFIEHPEKLKGFTYNEDEKDLICEDIGKIKKCEVIKDHFKGKKSGLYFIKHKNHLNNNMISYEIPPIEVNLESVVPSKGIINRSSFIYSLLFVLLNIM